MRTCKELIDQLSKKRSDFDRALIEKAYEYAKDAHSSQIRASGEPYFSHPVEVTWILAKMGMDTASIITGLLHDTVEDTDVTLDRIKTLFGEEVASLVDGVTKLSRLELQSDKTKQAENFRKLVLAMSGDIRVLLVKLADRLHNMRTIEFKSSEEKRKKTARETMDIYAPLAERIGMQELKDELQDLSFAQLNPDARDSIISRLEFLKTQESDPVQSVVEEIKKLLKKEGVNAKVFGREKLPYSIWAKMQKKNISFEQLSDIIAFRIKVDTIPECYQVLGIIHSNYLVLPNRFKDYISTPKPNGYRSLHTAVIGPSRHRIEIQIRTHEMHAIAELGVAAHWQYKQNLMSDGKQYRWLRGLLDIIERASGPEEFMEHTKMEMFQDQVFCFTPKGDLISLPRGATPVDFAYAVHSAVGDKCSGAKVNGKMRPLRARLENGDQVDIITSENHKPSPTWERFVVTGKARTRIRSFIRSQQREQYTGLGKSILTKAFRKESADFSEKKLSDVLRSFKVSTVEDLYASIGEGLTSPIEVVHSVFPELKEKIRHQEPLDDGEQKRIAKINKAKPGEKVSLLGLIPGMAVHYAGCCHPLPGDDIVGIVSTGRGITIHVSDCDQLADFEDEPDRWIDVDWQEANDPGRKFVVRLFVVLANQPGSLGALSVMVAKQEGNIINLKITNRSFDFFDLLLDIEVTSVKHLENVVAYLQTSTLINEVRRI